MAISYTNYVDIKSIFAGADPADNDFSALLFVGKSTNLKSDVKATDAKKVAFDNHEVVSFSFSNVDNYFAAESSVAPFAERYFLYQSPRGSVPSLLKVVKMTTVEENGETRDETPLEAFKRVIENDDASFGTFFFIDADPSQAGVAGQLKEVADENEKLNNFFRMVVNVTAETIDNFKTDNKMWSNKGLTFTLGCPYLTMAILAATDYTEPNSATVQMYKTLTDEPATVKSDEDKEEYDGLLVNYYGQTKAHGLGAKSFYQNGYNADGTDTACYDNEMWFKRTILSNLLDLETRVERIPASPVGVAMVVNSIMSVVTQALSNGTICPEKPISAAKRAYVTQLAGGQTDALDVLNQRGYILAANIKTRSDGKKDTYVIVYRIIYLKGDSVRKIEGTHNII